MPPTRMGLPTRSNGLGCWISFATCLDIETVPDRDLIPDWGEKWSLRNGAHASRRHSIRLAWPLLPALGVSSLALGRLRGRPLFCGGPKFDPCPGRQL